MIVIENAMKKIESGDVEKGLNELAQLEQNSDHETKYVLAETYYQLGHLEKAKHLVEELLLLYPDEGELFTFAAEILIELDEEGEAIEMLSEVKETDPAYIRAQLLLADLYQMEGLDEVAEQKLLKAAALVPEEPIISFGLGEFYLERGDYLKSIPYFKKVLHSGEKFEQVNIELRLAEAYSGSGEFEEALIYYEKGLEEKTELHALFGYGYTAFQVGEYDQAIKQFTKLKELDPHFTSFYPYLAKCYEALNKWKEALDTLEEGIKVDEYNDELYVHAGKLSFKMQDIQAGEEFLRKVIAQNPSHFEAIRTLVAFLKEEERYEEILDLVDHLNELGEDDPLFTWYRAFAHHQLEHFVKAYESFKDAHPTFEKDSDFLEEYGRFLLEYGKRDEAIELLRKAVHIDHTKLEVKEFLDNLEPY